MSLSVSYVSRADRPYPDAPLPPLRQELAAAEAGRPALPAVQERPLAHLAGAEAVEALVPALRAQVDVEAGDADDVPEVQEQAVAGAEGGMMGMLDVLGTMKEVGELIVKADNIDLMRRLFDAQTQVAALYEENRALKERLVVRDQLVFRQNTYWRGEDGPFCSRCWDAESLLMRIHVTEEFDPMCPKCHTVSSPSGPTIA